MKLSSLANQALTIKLVAAVTSYGFTIVLARTMYPAGFGWVAFFLNLSLFLSVIGARGQQMAALKFVPNLLGDRQQSGLSSFIYFSIRKAAIGTLIVWAAVILAIAGSIGLGWINNIPLVDLLLGVALIPLVGLIDLQSHWARACKFLSLSLIPKDILWRGLVGGIVVAVYLFQNQTPVDSTIVLFALVSILGVLAVFQVKVLANRTRLFEKPDTSSAPNPEWQSSANPFWVTSVSNIFMGTADVVIVGLIAGPVVAGIYFAANRLAMLLSFFSTSYNIALAPLVSHAWQAGRFTDVSQLLQQSTLNTTIPTTIAGLFLAIFAPQFLAMFGPEFSSAVMPLRVLIIAAVVNAATGPADIALNMCGFHQQAKIASTISLAVSATCLTVGVILAGTVGIASAILISTIFRKGLFWWLAFKLLTVRTDILAGVTVYRLGKDPV